MLRLVPPRRRWHRADQHLAGRLIAEQGPRQPTEHGGQLFSLLGRAAGEQFRQPIPASRDQAIACLKSVGGDLYLGFRSVTAQVAATREAA